MGIGAKSFEGRSALRFVQLRNQGNPATAGIIELGVAPCDGEIDDVVVSQRTAGVGGVYREFQVNRQRVGGAVTPALATQARLTLAAGAGAAVDAKKKIAAIAGCVRPVLHGTKANRRVKKGDAISVTVTDNGAYGTAPFCHVCVCIKPDI